MERRRWQLGAVPVVSDPTSHPGGGLLDITRRENKLSMFVMDLRWPAETRGRGGLGDRKPDYGSSGF